MQANDLLFCASSALNRGGRVGMSVDGTNRCGAVHTKPGWLSHRRVLGLSLEGEFQEDACRVEGSSKGRLLCLAMNADLLSDRFRQSSQISISVPNSTTCLAGTPKKVAEPLALCCRNAKRVSRHTAMPTISSLGMIVSRPT